MNEISTLLIYLQPHFDKTHLKQLLLISHAMLSMNGRVTMLGMSRWTEKGGSYRTIQRFFASQIEWLNLNWRLCKAQLHKENTLLIAGDATTVTKSGHQTFGVGRFFSSLQSRVVPGIAFQQLSLIGTSTRKAYPMLMEQIKPKPKKVKTKSKKKIANASKSQGRPKGSKNKCRKSVELNDEMIQVKSMLLKVLACIGDTFNVGYFLYDGAFGNNAAVQMTRQTGLHLICKLRRDSALYFLCEAPYLGRGAPKKYGTRANYKDLPTKYIKQETTEGNIRTRVYQFTARHKKIADKLNVVVIEKTNMHENKTGHVVLFSTDLTLSDELLIDYYSLRFQIEFNFRDAKQYWGLEDFMTVKEQAVCNAANISMWMVNVSQLLLNSANDASILDLKARFHGEKYAREVFKMLPESARVINIDEIIRASSTFSRIHQEKIAA